jgi:putative phage-type endonuclease
MKFIDVEQGSPEWHELRRTKIGSSDAPVIMGFGYKTQAKLMEEKWKAKEGYTNANMQRGRDVEPLARAMVSKLRGTDYKPVVALSSEIDWQMASLDGWDGFEFTEIKCPNDETFQRVKNGDIPMDYYWQVQHECCVTNTSYGWLDVVKAKWDKDKSEWVIEDHIPTKIQKQESQIGELIHHEWEFHRKMVNYEMPQDVIIERKDERFLKAIAELKQIREAMEQLDDLEKLRRDEIISIAEERSCRGGGMTVSRYFDPGRISYSKIPNLKQILESQGIDLKKYTSEAMMRWKIA